MPLLVIETNVSKDKINEEILKELSKCLCNTIGKPEKFCSTLVKPDQLMTFGGSTEPCAAATLMSIGKLGVEENKKHSAVISEFVEKYFGVPKSRMYINFVDKSPSEIGYNGTTFH